MRTQEHIKWEHIKISCMNSSPTLTPRGWEKDWDGYTRSNTERTIVPFFYRSGSVTIKIKNQGR